LIVQVTQEERFHETKQTVPRPEAVDPIEAGPPRLCMRRSEEFHHLVCPTLGGQLTRQQCDALPGVCA
jgi:hypothetical protein